MLSNERLDEIEKRTEAATPGPWDTANDWRECAIYSITQNNIYGVGVRVVQSGNQNNYGCFDPAIYGRENKMHGVTYEHDARFIAHARQYVPELLAEVRRLKAENERLRELTTPRPIETAPIDGTIQLNDGGEFWYPGRYLTAEWFEINGIQDCHDGRLESGWYTYDRHSEHDEFYYQIFPKYWTPALPQPPEVTA